MAEGDVLQAAIAGDRDALASLLEQYAPQLRGRLKGKIASRWQAVLDEDDVLQETYAEAFLEIGTFRPGDDDSFLAWLTKIANNNLLDAIRGLEAEKRGGKRRSVGQVSLEDSAVALYDLLSDPGTSPSQDAARNEVCRLMRQAVDELPDAYARLVEAYDLQGQSVTDVAAALGCTPGAFFMRRARAHRSLRQVLGRESGLS